jgi:hypothetical protein
MGRKVCRDSSLSGLAGSNPAFLEDVGLPPTPQHLLARLDYDKDFEPGNVRWIPRTEHDKRAITHSVQQKYKDKPKPSDDQ